ACGCRQPFERVANERVLGKAANTEARRWGGRDPGDEVETLVDRRQLVPAVVGRADDEREVQLRGRGRARHSSACASAPNPPGGSASARVTGSWPTFTSAAAACSREASPASSSEFGSCLRRCAN